MVKETTPIEVAEEVETPVEETNENTSTESIIQEENSEEELTFIEKLLEGTKK